MEAVSGSEADNYPIQISASSINIEVQHINHGVRAPRHDWHAMHDMINEVLKHAI